MSLMKFLPVALVLTVAGVAWGFGASASSNTDGPVTKATFGCCVTGNCCCPGQGACCDPAAKASVDTAPAVVEAGCCVTGNCCCPGQGACCGDANTDVNTLPDQPTTCCKK